MLTRAETGYRNEWRSLTGAAISGSLVDACAGWLIRGDALVARAHRDTIDHLARLPHEDWTWGTATAHERLLHRLTVPSPTRRGPHRAASAGPVLQLNAGPHAHQLASLCGASLQAAFSPEEFPLAKLLAV